MSNWISEHITLGGVIESVVAAAVFVAITKLVSFLWRRTKSSANSIIRRYTDRTVDILVVFDKSDVVKKQLILTELQMEFMYQAITAVLNGIFLAALLIMAAVENVGGLLFGAAMIVVAYWMFEAWVKALWLQQRVRAISAHAIDSELLPRDPATTSEVEP